MSDDDRQPKDDARAIILARRRQFLTFALTGAGVALAVEGCDGKKETTGDPMTDPQVCLKVALPDDEGSEAKDAGPGDAGTKPRVCLDVAPPDEPKDGGADTKKSADGGTADGGTADGGAKEVKPQKPRPRACLKVAPPKPPPKPCLKFAPPGNENDPLGGL